MVTMVLKSCCVLSLLVAASAFVTPTNRLVAWNTRLAAILPPSEGFDPSSTLLSQATAETYVGAAKTAVIGLAFGGGLIPALIAGNKAMMKTLTGDRRRDGDDDNPETSLDPTLGDPNRRYIEDSGATGPEIPKSNLLFANEKIPLSDIVAVVGRIGSTNDVANWADLPSVRVPDLAMPDNPPMWLPRSAYKVNVRKLPFLQWPVDPTTGEPVGGAALKEAEEARVSQPGALIGDAALDAVFDSWTWGASIATPDKVEKQLAKWRPNEKEFDLNKFVNAAVFGRAQTGLGAFTFILIQVVALGTLFLAPALRTFADIDIGFGEYGTCDPEKCLRLWNF